MGGDGMWQAMRGGLYGLGWLRRPHCCDCCRAQAMAAGQILLFGWVPPAHGLWLPALKPCEDCLPWQQGHVLSRPTAS